MIVLDVVGSGTIVISVELDGDRIGDALIAKAPAGGSDNGFRLVLNDEAEPVSPAVVGAEEEFGRDRKGSIQADFGVRPQRTGLVVDSLRDDIFAARAGRMSAEDGRER